VGLVTTEFEIQWKLGGPRHCLKWAQSFGDKMALNQSQIFMIALGSTVFPQSNCQI
jgi:hypothetical protein